MQLPRRRAGRSLRHNRYPIPGSRQEHLCLNPKAPSATSRPRGESAVAVRIAGQRQGQGSCWQAPGDRVDWL
jgi:hypothetical protein